MFSPNMKIHKQIRKIKNDVAFSLEISYYDGIIRRRNGFVKSTFSKGQFLAGKTLQSIERNCFVATSFLAYFFLSHKVTRWIRNAKPRLL